VDVDTLGEYTLTYRVSDAAGNEAVVIRVVSVVIDDPYADYIFQDTEELVDGNFTTTTTVPAEVQDTEENGYADITDSGFWYSYIADWDGAAATFSVVEGAMNIDITAVGGADWSVMLKQKGLSLVPGTVYQLSFTASASAARDIIARVTNDYGRTFNITSTPQTYRFSFLYEGGELSDQLVIFLVGNTENYAAGTVIIDNVVFSEGTNPLDLIFQDTEELVDGNFTTTTTVPAEVQDTEENGYADITDSGFWYSYIADWDGAAATFSVVEGAMNIDITAVGGADWSVMLKQKGLSLVPGTVYQLSFTASASAARDIIARVTNDYGRTFNITSTPQTYRFSFLYEGGELSDQLVIFLVGNTENYAAGTVIIDNVVFSAEDK
jgi:hypothetical protein